ncbi:hypothetical protein MAPG_01898 [Magnaporthiopsis poae ATCC 64411]|uniref:BPL/LPL catalytic domain-containing protein n=1 Tax=Magnaporthiopsis poae (strain ATCC 64411 / 73-15) TaxID=644358 RepID=A0A0C4DPW8_MAGP6|nr:hypothetical protein MAPG_01898 [Magnaporthiopsis poae ATCC 64411]
MKTHHPLPRIQLHLTHHHLLQHRRLSPSMTRLQPYLRHIHLPSDAAQTTYPSYCVAAAIQARLQRAQLDFKAASSSSSSSPSPPPPALVTFTPTPTYTLGRRQHSSFSSSFQSKTLPPSLQALTKPLHFAHHPTTTTTAYEPVVLRTSRGGLTTYHGPGQLVIWPVLDLKGGGGFHRPYTVRSYASLLQTVTCTILARLWGLVGTTTCDPGVWLTTAGEVEKEETRKVAAMGVHLRRHVTGLGVALNLSTPVTSSSSSSANSTTDAEGSNPWLRFVPCGLEGKHVTSVAEELRLRGGDDEAGLDLNLDPVRDAGRAVADAWAAEFAARIARDQTAEKLAVVTVDDGEVRQLVADVAGEAKLIEEESRLWPARPDGQDEPLRHPADIC